VTSDTESTFTTKPRELLPNGAYLLGKFWAENTKTWVLLATWDRGTGREWITWLRNETDGIFSGRYYGSLTRALESFTTRIAEEVNR
jgi:hypothetical protein